MERIAPYRKAVIGAVLAAAAALVGVAEDGSITSVEWLTVLGFLILGAAGVYAVPNKPKPAA